MPNYKTHHGFKFCIIFNRSGSPEKRSRIVTVSSAAHAPGTMNFEDLQSKYVLQYKHLKNHDQTGLIAVITDGHRFNMQTRRKGQSGIVLAH